MFIIKKLFLSLIKILCGFFGVIFLFTTIGGLVNCFLDCQNIKQYIPLTLIFFSLGLILLKISKTISASSKVCISRHQEKEAESKISSIQYMQDGNSIVHTDGSPITDEEVPYLMQLGYEESLRQTGQYNGEVLDTSFVVRSLAEKKNATIIPAYQEIINFPTNCSSNIFSTDIFFLKYINGRSVENANIAQYWYYEYGLNYANELKKLYSSDMLRISNVNISKLKIADLKNILRHFNLPLSGKKADLMNRILDNISSEDLSSFLGDSIHYFCATNKGISLIESLNDSATFNLELENEAISLILDYDYEDAFNLIWDYKKQTPAEKNTHYEYSSNMDETYDSIMTPCGFFYTLEKDRDIEEKIRAAIVFCRMYGLGQDKIRKLIMRIYKENDHIFSEDAKNLINGRLL